MEWRGGGVAALYSTLRDLGAFCLFDMFCSLHVHWKIPDNQVISLNVHEHKCSCSLPHTLKHTDITADTHNQSQTLQGMHSTGYLWEYFP